MFPIPLHKYLLLLLVSDLVSARLTLQLIAHSGPKGTSDSFPEPPAQEILLSLPAMKKQLIIFPNRNVYLPLERFWSPRNIRSLDPLPCRNIHTSHAGSSTPLQKILLSLPAIKKHLIIFQPETFIYP